MLVVSWLIRSETSLSIESGNVGDNLADGIRD